MTVPFEMQDLSDEDYDKLLGLVGDHRVDVCADCGHVFVEGDAWVNVTTPEFKIVCVGCAEPVPERS